MDSAERILRGMPRRGAGGPQAGVPSAWSPSPSTKRMIITALVLAASLCVSLVDGDVSGFSGGGSKASATRRR